LPFIIYKFVNTDLFFSSEGVLIPLSRIKNRQLKENTYSILFFFLNFPEKSRGKAKVVISSDFDV
jgi:hypothetical protein